MSAEQQLVPQSQEFFDIYKSIPNINNLYGSHRTIPELKKIVNKLIRKNKDTQELLLSEIVVFEDFKKMLGIITQQRTLNRQDIKFALKCRKDMVTAMNERLDFMEEAILSNSLLETDNENFFRKILFLIQSVKTVIAINGFIFNKYLKEIGLRHIDNVKASRLNQIDKIPQIMLQLSLFMYLIYEEDEKQIDSFIEDGLKGIISRKHLLEYKDQVIITNAQL